MLRPKRKSPFTNAMGQAPHKSLEPPDLTRCQANPNMLRWTPFTLGPMPTPKRCPAAPSVVIVENKTKNPDGKVGSMSLCAGCLDLYKLNFGAGYAKVHKIQ